MLPPIFDHAIVFGQRVGPVPLGMTIAQVQGAFGEPQHGTPYSSTRVGYVEPKLRLSFVTESGVVVQVSPTDGSYATALGIRVGSPLPASAGATEWTRKSHGVALYCFTDRTFVTVRTSEQAGASPDCAVGTICDIAVGGCNP